MNSNNLHTVAQAFYAEREFDRAIDICLDIIAEDPEDHAAKLLMADSYFQQDLPENTERLYEEVITRISDDFLINYKYMLVLLKLGKFQKAVRFFKDIGDHNSYSDEDNAKLYAMNAQAFIQMEQFDQAEKYLRKSIEMTKDNFKYLQGLAKLLYMKEEFEEAEGLYLRLLEEKSEIEIDFITLAETLIELDKTGPAMEYLKKVKRNVHKEHVFILKAYVSFINDDMSGFRDNMGRLYSDLINITDNLFYYENFALTLMRTGRLKKAIKALEMVMEREQNIEDDFRYKFRILLFGMYLADGEKKKAYKLLSEEDPVTAMISAVNYFNE
ncbi:MAG: tetratricopeptide repeat protein, partial [Candidatus Muiribacteriaceae bacterium]